MGFLKFLEGIRNPFFDWFFSLITQIGDETVFLAISIFVFWCVNKRRGYYVLTVGLAGTAVNQLLKLSFRVERPWIKDSTLTTVDGAKEGATGYSFPSGHTQNVTGTLTSITLSAKKHRVRSVVISAIIILLVAFSRMYLGVHTPLDVLVSLAVALAISFAVYPLFKTEERFERFMPYVVFGSMLLSLIFMLYFPIFKDVSHDAANLNSAMKTAYTMAGCTIGIAAVWFIDGKYVKFDTRAIWYVQIIKLVGGFGGVLIIKELLEKPINLICAGNAYIGALVRYFLIVVFAGILWPMLFKYFGKIKCRPLDNFALWVNKILKRNDTGIVECSSDNVTAAADVEKTVVRYAKKKRKPSWKKQNKKNKKRYKK